jgi:hypothetical protein
VAVRVQEAAPLRIDAIYRWTRDRRGAAQYVARPLEAFGRLTAGAIRDTYDV